MTKKKARIQKARKLRADVRAIGESLSLPESVKLARAMLGGFAFDILRAIPERIAREVPKMSCDCCVGLIAGITLKGPKGTLEIYY